MARPLIHHAAGSTARLQPRASKLRSAAADTVRSFVAGDLQLNDDQLATEADIGLFGPASMAWLVHGQTSMFVGGLRALLLQTLHPPTMAGVADHSNYRSDPWGRLHRTAHYIGATTYGTTPVAEATIERVRHVHQFVTGTTPTGEPYSASDPHLLKWVHLTEVDSFLAAYIRYRFDQSSPVDTRQRDRYVAEMADLGERLGVVDAPRTFRQLGEQLNNYRGELKHTKLSREAVRFLLRPPVPLPAAPAYGIVSAAALSLLPKWGKKLLGVPRVPLTAPLIVEPPARVLLGSLTWLMNDSAARSRAIGR